MNADLDQQLAEAIVVGKRLREQVIKNLTIVNHELDRQHQEQADKILQGLPASITAAVRNGRQTLIILELKQHIDFLPGFNFNPENLIGVAKKVADALSQTKTIKTVSCPHRYVGDDDKLRCELQIFW